MIISIDAENVFDKTTPIYDKNSSKNRRNLLQYSWTSLVAQKVKDLPAMWKTWV